MENYPILISFRAPKGTGKTTAAEYLIKEHGFTRISFADPLKDIAKRVTIDGRIDKARDRGLLQFLGTDYYRALDADYWVNQWKQYVTERIELTEGRARIVVDDCRFLNEECAIGFFGGRCAWIDGPTRIEDFSGIQGHISEQLQFDPMNEYKMYNKGDLASFHHQLDTFTHLIERVVAQRKFVDNSRCG